MKSAGPWARCSLNRCASRFSLTCWLLAAQEMYTFDNVPAQLFGMVQREFDQRQRELRRALRAENDENELRVRLPSRVQGL